MQNNSNDKNFPAVGSVSDFVSASQAGLAAGFLSGDDMTTTAKYDYPSIGCYIDESAGSADECNRRTIEFAQDYGFQANVCGFYDGLNGLTIGMTLDQAEACSHQGECDQDVQEVLKDPTISEQLDKVDPETLRRALKETGAWYAEQLSDHDANKARALWLAAGDIHDTLSEQLSEIADEALSFLNDLEDRPYMFWQFEDNSLYLIADADQARESVDFVSSKAQEYPADDYEGEWLHVNDHGNATLYVRENGQDREIWSIV